MPLTPSSLGVILQPLVCQMLGIDVSTDPLAYSKVRLGWQTLGQPGWGVSDDVCTIQATEEDDKYNRIRDLEYTAASSTSFTKTFIYTRVWRVAFSFYGPTGFDNARTLKSALLSTDAIRYALAASALYVVSDMPATVRAPELFQGQWWERSDFSVRMNEQVTETQTVSAIASVEVLTYTVAGLEADVVFPVS
jgi:hypothetical protein